MTSLSASPKAQQLSGAGTAQPAAEPTSLPFTPWPVPAALCLCLGIAFSGLEVPWWLALLVPVALVPVGWFLLQASPVWRLVLMLTLLIPVGFGRHAYWQAQPNPLASLMAQRLTFSGESDGRYLRIDSINGARHPQGTRVVLSPSGSVAPGRVTLVGDLGEPQGKRNPGGFDFQGYLHRRAVHGQVYVREVLTLEPARIGLRERLRQGVVAGLPERSAVLMQAMTLGIREGLGDLRDVFATSGLAHLLALSGLHVGILMAALGFLLKPLGRLRYPFMIAFVLSFVLLVGATPSVVRAGMMVTAVLLSLWLGAGRIEPWPALGIAAFLTLLWNPSWLFDLSFQLSYGAVAGILIFTTPIMKRVITDELHMLKWWDPRLLILGAAVVSTSAQLLTLPLVAHNFGSVPLFSPLINIIAVPLATLLVPLGFLAGLLGLLSPALAAFTNLLTGLLAHGLLMLADAASGLPDLVWGEIKPAGFILYMVGATAFGLILHRYLRPWRGVLVITIALVCSMLLTRPNRTELIYFDVGQGDASLIRLPNRTEILIDGGGTPFSDFDVGHRTVVPALRALGVNQLEFVIATHADTDHIEGLASVLEHIPVQTLLIGVPAPGKKVYDDLIDVAQRKGIPIIHVVRGESLRVGNARLEFLNPPHRTHTEENENSIAFVLHLNDTPKALFLGDLGITVEHELAFPDVDVLMVAHHGSRFSTSDGLLDASRPETAIISYGRNTYGHPHPSVLERLQTRGIQVRETFREGAIRIPLD